MAGQYAVYDPSAIIQMKMQDRAMERQDRQNTLNAIIQGVGVVSNAYLKKREMDQEAHIKEAQGDYYKARAKSEVSAVQQEEDFVKYIEANPEFVGAKTPAEAKAKFYQMTMMKAGNSGMMHKMETEAKVSTLFNGDSDPAPPNSPYSLPTMMEVTQRQDKSILSRSQQNIGSYGQVDMAQQAFDINTSSFIGRRSGS